MNQPIAPSKFGLGASARRTEDLALITGQGRYTGDIRPAGTLVAYVLRSAMAHARITLSGLDDARAAPGVHLVATAADIASLGDLPCKALVKQVDGTFPQVPPRPLLNGDTVRHVGDPIAFIVADTLNEAKSAAELIMVDYDGLDVVVDTMGALDPSAPLVWPDLGTNLAFTYQLGKPDDATKVFATADRTVTLSLVNNRLITNYMEPRACLGEFDAATGRYTLTAGTQGGHAIRDIVAPILGISPADLRVVTPDVGGGFGTKSFVYHEYPLVLWAARALNRPVSWQQERTEHFLSCAHGRDNVVTLSLAFDADAKITAMKVDLVANMGAYLNQYAPFIPYVGVTMTTGLYDIPVLDVKVRGVYTHTVPVDAYRGAGRPEAAYHLERLMDYAADQLGLDRAELRRRNFIRPDQLPYRTQTGRLYDTGEFAGHLDQALSNADVAGFEARRAEAASRGKWRGLGFASYIEACAFPGSENAEVILETDGTITLLIGTQTNGQGHGTAYAQVIAGKLGISIDQVKMIQGDTDRVKTGGGTGGSRSVPLGAASVDLASRALIEKIKIIAADKLEASVGDIEVADGLARVAGTDRSITLQEVALAAPDEAARSAAGAFKQPEATYPNGTHVCELEVDPETGVVTIDRYTIVDDFGVTVNPILLAGQVHGGVAQGIGQALTERTVFDESGQLVTASFMDYGMPRADDIPSFSFSTRNVPSTTNMLGIKGAGEAGTIGACGAVMNALIDALKPAGITHLDMPATPEVVWKAANGMM